MQAVFRLKYCGLLNLVVLAAVSMWPTWRWYISRISDGSDEPYGLIALVTLVALSLFLPRSESHASPISLIIPAALVFLSVLIKPWAPPLIAAIPGVLGLTSLLSLSQNGRSFNPGLSGLALLSLPILPSVHFYLGYPIRFLSALLVSKLLSSAGIPVSAAGTLLSYREQLIWIDAPCSGIHMLWGGAFVNFTLIAYYNLRGWRVSLALATGSTLIFAANISRTAFVFLSESGIISAPEIFHTALGLLIFLSAITTLALVTTYVAGFSEISSEAIKQLPTISNKHYLAYSSGYLGLILLSFAPIAKAKTPLLIQAPSWPTTFEGSELRQIPLDTLELTLSRDFPGHIGRFWTADKEILIRIVTSPTRRLHASADCLRAAGYSITPIAAVKMANKVGRACVVASQAGSRLKVCEFISDANGNTWPDVSSWYWASLLGKTSGPWQAFTISESIERDAAML
jgi:exosortase/archaeosortase family protein